ncbi:hypothetical protein ARMGADRAFT_1039414 [Armillaria gallica]|uniref:Uncharacterized protein n=1 Tax=Armillaria gallica TaxID=47427 RepID=A0A2H3CJ52_ARMGA|nr:hypothetical protein ARMGADRAFT_1039414 [Armillaria gallica]
MATCHVSQCPHLSRLNSLFREVPDPPFIHSASIPYMGVIEEYDVLGQIMAQIWPTHTNMAIKFGFQTANSTGTGPYIQYPYPPYVRYSEVGPGRNDWNSGRKGCLALTKVQRLFEQTMMSTHLYIPRQAAGYRKGLADRCSGISGWSDSPDISVNKDKKETFAGVATCLGIDQKCSMVLQPCQTRNLQVQGWVLQEEKGYDVVI